MPIVHVNVWEGFGQEKAKTVIQNITQVFVDLGIPAHAVEVIVHEIQKSHWGVGGEPASEKLKDESPPKGKNTKGMKERGYDQTLVSIYPTKRFDK